MNLEPVPLFLVLLGGFCWTVVYLDGIRLGIRDRTYAVPFWALALNFAWELLNAALGYQHAGLNLQIGIIFIWALFDLIYIAMLVRTQSRERRGELTGQVF